MAESTEQINTPHFNENEEEEPHQQQMEITTNEAPIEPDDEEEEYEDDDFDEEDEEEEELEESEDVEDELYSEEDDDEEEDPQQQREITTNEALTEPDEDEDYEDDDFNEEDDEIEESEWEEEEEESYSEEEDDDDDDDDGDGDDEEEEQEEEINQTLPRVSVNTVEVVGEPSSSGGGGGGGELATAGDEGGEIEGLNCPICMAPWTSGGDHQLCCLSCGHLYGLSCIKKWIEHRKGSAKCPQCNMRCKQKDVRVLYASRVVVCDEESNKGRMHPHCQQPPQQFLDQWNELNKMVDEFKHEFRTGQFDIINRIQHLEAEGRYQRALAESNYHFMMTGECQPIPEGLREEVEAEKLRLRIAYALHHGMPPPEA